MEIYFDNKINDYIYKVSEVIKIHSVEVMKDYKLLINFSNGEKRLYDVKPLLVKPLYFPLKNISLFNKAHVECGTVVWNDDLDLCPESLYNDSILIEDE